MYVCLYHIPMTMQVTQKVWDHCTKPVHVTRDVKLLGRMYFNSSKEYKNNYKEMITTPKVLEYQKLNFSNKFTSIKEGDEESDNENDKDVENTTMDNEVNDGNEYDNNVRDNNADNYNSIT
jgi:hypothetical protein